ncbi:MAG: hypothetical protein Q9227_002950 [Pyrenula ochraceoflavens]
MSAPPPTSPFPRLHSLTHPLRTLKLHRLRTFLHKHSPLASPETVHHDSEIERRDRAKNLRIRHGAHEDYYDRDFDDVYGVTGGAAAELIGGNGVDMPMPMSKPRRLQERTTSVRYGDNGRRTSLDSYMRRVAAKVQAREREQAQSTREACNCGCAVVKDCGCECKDCNTNTNTTNTTTTSKGTSTSTSRASTEESSGNGNGHVRFGNMPVPDRRQRGRASFFESDFFSP